MNFAPSLKIIIFIFFFIIGNLFSPSIVKANATVSVTFQVGAPTNLGTIKFEGTSIPLSIITFVENNTVIGTSSSDSLGNFVKTFELVSPGSHKISIYATDPQGKNGSPYIYEAIAIPDKIITISGIILSSTANASSQAIKKNEKIVFTGYASPSAIIEVHLNNTYFGEITSNQFGQWIYNLDTKHLNTEKYEIFFIVKYNNQLGSASDKINFEVESTSSSKEEQTTTTVESVVTSVITYTENLLSNIETIDISYKNLLLGLFPNQDKDNDNKLSQEEGLSLIEEWITHWKNEEINKCDINKDVACNLIDMSVALYYINR